MVFAINETSRTRKPRQEEKTRYVKQIFSSQDLSVLNTLFFITCFKNLKQLDPKNSFSLKEGIFLNLSGFRQLISIKVKKYNKWSKSLWKRKKVGLKESSSDMIKEIEADAQNKRPKHLYQPNLSNINTDVLKVIKLKLIYL